MKIIFMGTSEFAINPLESLLNNPQIEISAIYTKAPSISGRGNKINISAIHEIANKRNLKTYHPASLKNIDVYNQINDLKPDVIIVVSYGLILPKEILSIPKFGCYNIHPSKLPLYRGSAPLQRSIMNGETKSAVCIIKMTEGLDSGDIVNAEDFNINDDEDFSDIILKSSKIGADLLIKTLDDIRANKLKSIEQDHDKATYASKILKTESIINWNKNSHEIFNLVRSLNGNIGANMVFDNEIIKILKVNYKKTQSNFVNGEIIDNKLTIKCNDGFIYPQILQKSGKKPLSIKDFLNGFKFEVGKII